MEGNATLIQRSIFPIYKYEKKTEVKFTQKEPQIKKKGDRQETSMYNINLERNMVIMAIYYPIRFPCYPKCPILSEDTANTAIEEFPFSIDMVLLERKADLLPKFLKTHASKFILYL